MLLLFVVAARERERESDVALYNKLFRIHKSTNKFNFKIHVNPLWFIELLAHALHIYFSAFYPCLIHAPIQKTAKSRRVVDEGQYLIRLVARYRSRRR